MNIIDTFCGSEKSSLFATPSGERYREQFIGKLDKNNGEVVLTSVGKIDQYQEIQSHKSEADIETLIQRASAGDLSAFSSAVFGDFTDMPESYADALNVVIEAEREFNHLPQYIRDKFDNDWHKYITTAGSEEWFNKFNDNENNVDNSVKKDEVVDNVQEQ